MFSGVDDVYMKFVISSNVTDNECMLQDCSDASQPMSRCY